MPGHTKWANSPIPYYQTGRSTHARSKQFGQSDGAISGIFHEEATDDLARVLEEMKKYPFQRAVAINPPTSVSRIAPHIKGLDAVLVMSVNPGFQQQEFIADVLPKMSEIRTLREDITIGLDGGINENNIQKVFEAGADYVAVGSAVMKAEDPALALRKLEEMIE